MKIIGTIMWSTKPQHYNKSYFQKTTDAGIEGKLMNKSVIVTFRPGSGVLNEIILLIFHGNYTSITANLSVVIERYGTSTLSSFLY